MKILKSLTLTGFVFGFAGWVYTVISYTFHRETLTWQLTHLTPWIREDTFGIVSFAVSFVSFFLWNLVREEKK